MLYVVSAWFQNHVLRSTCINNVVMPKHPLLSAKFDFSKLLKNMALEKKNVTLFPFFEMPLKFLIAFKSIFLLLFQSLPLSLISRRERWEIRKGRENVIFQSNREFEWHLPK